MISDLNRRLGEDCWSIHLISFQHPRVDFERGIDRAGAKQAPPASVNRSRTPVGLPVSDRMTSFTRTGSAVCPPASKQAASRRVLERDIRPWRCYDERISIHPRVVIVARSLARSSTVVVAASIIAGPSTV